jgi:endogenous inhibitor of DNA gyrase (YacG/DUF329 family)
MKLTCPICEKVEDAISESAWPEFPFCSPRCKLIDLGRWLREDYRVPTESEDTEHFNQDPAN